MIGGKDKMKFRTLAKAAGILTLAAASLLYSANNKEKARASSGLETKVESVEVKKSKLPEKYSFMKVYESVIEKNVSYFNKKHEIKLDSNLIMAMIITESGGERDRNGAFKYDPMQIANQGDYALDILVKGREDVKFVGDFLRLNGRKKTPWNKEKKCWDYSNTNLTAEESIYGGIGWLLNKAVEVVEEGQITDYVVKSGDNLWKIAKENGSTLETLKEYNKGIDYDNLKIGQKIKFRKASRKFNPNGINWEEAVKRYNGGGDSNYANKVDSILKELKASKD